VVTRRRRKNEFIEVVPDVLKASHTWGCNVYMITSPGLAFIDTGFPLDARTLKDWAASVDPEGPEWLVATHCHLDHTGSMHRLKEAFGSRIAAHEDDAGVMEGTVPYMKFKLDPLHAVYYKVLSPLYPFEYVDVDRRLSDGDVLDLLGGLEVVSVPGHTDGSIALYQRERRLLFTGDTIRNEGGVLDGPPPQFTPRMDEAFDGIERRLMTLDFEVLLPGHGDPITAGAREAVGRMLDARGRGTR
jgi:glyoxylase-like metal-dependent hydrolase (beta-lactamase superfamily II)